MGLGVLEDLKLSHVPGTVLLDDNAAELEDVHRGLKHGTGKDSNIVLSPQPSEDPNDPLNWSPWRKEIILGVLLFGGMLNTATNGPFLNASYFEIGLEINQPLTVVVLASGYNLLAAGCIGPFVCALSRKYGKRPVYLLSTLLDIIGTAVGQSGVDYKRLLAARIIQGFSTSAFESILVATIGDMYFVHQRGARVAAVNFILNAAANVASIICGQVFSSLGYLWLFNMFQIFLVVQFLLMFFLCPETTYIRDSHYEIDINREDRLEDLKHIEESYREKHQDHQIERTATNATIAKKTYIQQLAPFSRAYHNDWIFKDLLGPFLTLLNPAACYAVITSGLINTWFVGTAIIISGIFSGPPWMFNAAQVGYIGAGPFVGGILASLFTAFAGDPAIKYMGRKNKGVYEPEFRLIFMAIAGVACALGMFLFGYAVHVGANASLCAFLFGVEMFGIIVGIWSSISYALDAFRNLSSEMFIMNMLFKNFMFYAFSNFANNWVAADGPEQIMYVFGGTSIFLSLLAIPVYIYGKRLRSWWARHDLFVILHMQKSGPALEAA